VSNPDTSSANGPRHRKPVTTRHVSTQTSRSSGRAKALPIGIAAVVVVVGLASFLVFSRSSPLKTGFNSPPSAVPLGSNPTTAADHGPPVCPLTGTPAPGGKVPARPALAIKVGNNPSARPQSGLSKADIVIEEPIEGAITRLIAIYQCQGAPQVGPVRSTRWIDLQMLEQLGHPIFGFAGGINPDQALIASSPLFDADYLGSAYSEYYRDNNELAPNNLYVATSSLWGLDHSTTPPPALFTYSEKPLTGRDVKAISAADLTWSGLLEVTWQWQASSGRWLRFYGSSPADGASGAQLSATNVVIERVATVPGPYVEDSEGAHGVHSITVGKGPAMVLRNGVAISGYWERSSIAQITRFVTGSGKTITLAPGNTWIELVPNYASVTTTPAS
jgi:hypothetical protein